MRCLIQCIPETITFLVFLVTVARNFLIDGWRDAPIPYLSASILLASPFLMLLVAHAKAGTNYKAQVLLAVGNLPFVVAWLVASFAIRWMHAGVEGTLQFGFLLSSGALLYAAWVRKLCRTTIEEQEQHGRAA